MNKQSALSLFAAPAFGAAMASPASATSGVGSPAPTFLGTDHSGSQVTLDAYPGNKKGVARHSERRAALSRLPRDPYGECRRAVAARHTPAMAVIDLNETLAYYAENNCYSKWHPSLMTDAIKYLCAALTELKNGRHVPVSKIHADCCSSKYTD